MEDPILPGVGSVAAHVEENGVANQVGLGTNEVRHELSVFDSYKISHQLSQWEVLWTLSELSQVRSSLALLLLRLDDPTR